MFRKLAKHETFENRTNPCIFKYLDVIITKSLIYFETRNLLNLANYVEEAKKDRICP